MSTHPPELRPYRVATYVFFGLFTAIFIGGVIRSVWLDLYGRPVNAHVGGFSVVQCTDEINALQKELDARLSQPLAPRVAKNSPSFDQDWDRFTRTFEDRLHRVQASCIEGEPSGNASPQVRDAMAITVERLDTLRQHLARCGQDGARERESLSAAIDQLKAALSTP